jgi:hypothetical protein
MNSCNFSGSHLFITSSLLDWLRDSAALFVFSFALIETEIGEFTVQCKFQRQNYRKLKRKYKRYKTEAVKNELDAAERQYKRTLD